MLEELYKLEGDSGEQALRVVIVSSLAGGTGSGLILALLLKVSTPAAEFDKKVGKDIMRESLQMIYEYMSTIVLGDDLDWIYGNFVFDQVKAFDKNVDWYFANWRDDFSDYVDDLMQIAANELENKEQENLCEKMQELIENARERRE